MGQRLLRTRTKIAHAGISLRVPEPHRLDERTAGVLAVIYLVFNEGYAPTDDGAASATTSPRRRCISRTSSRSCSRATTRF